ncbi:EAF6 [Candida metapsilosis]|uniref:Chromatin modification-related protein EAF6 n=1 Tax=Candida metapsilosis TaxID=273372 RepID=A0A8H7ZC80_9ASCO|nr:EAF6 [Candida metapsilosis]
MANEEMKEMKNSSQKKDSTEDKPAVPLKAAPSPSKGAGSDQSKSPQKNNNKSDNSTPSSQSKASTPSSSSTKQSKGAASVEKYNDLKKKLTQQILKKQEIANKLAKLEDTIYQKESSYFEESYSGNIVKGFENFSKSSGGGASATGGGGGSGASGFKRRIVYTEDDHIFSLSSISFVKNMVKRHGAGYAAAANGALANATASSIINARDDFDDYEDSVDPTTANLGIKPGNAGAAGSASATPVAASVALENNKQEISRSSTPSRKRKARTIED